MEILIQLWRPEFEFSGINSGIWYYCLLLLLLPQPFYGSLLFGTTRVSRYQKKHSPSHTYHGHQSFLICFLHLLRSIASSLFTLRAWQSFCTKRETRNRWHSLSVLQQNRLQCLGEEMYGVWSGMVPDQETKEDLERGYEKILSST